MNAQEAFGRLCEFISDSMRKLAIPGVAVGVISGDQEFSAGVGVTNVDHPLQVDADTLFQIGSTTKTFTGTAVMRLVEMSKLALDEPVRTYLPDFAVRDADASARVTIRHLLTHTAGWVGDIYEDTGNGDDALKEYTARMATLPQLTPVGTVWSYNNSAFWLAGRIIEVATGLTYERAMLELVLEPLALTRSFLMPADVMTHRFAVGQVRRQARARVCCGRGWGRALPLRGERLLLRPKTFCVTHASISVTEPRRTGSACYRQNRLRRCKRRRWPQRSE